MFDNKTICQKCKDCCKFKAEDVDFAPIFSRPEIDLAMAEKRFDELFKPLRNSTDVFQVRLIQSQEDKELFACPFLDESTHLCKIYNIRPLDCKIWPLVIMKDRDSKKTLLTYLTFHCDIMNEFSAVELKNGIKKLESWFDESNFIEAYKQYPDLIWDYDPDATLIKKLNLS